MQWILSRPDEICRLSRITTLSPSTSLQDIHCISSTGGDVDGSFQEQNVSYMDITNLSMEVVYPFKNPSTNSVTTFLSVDKLYELASTQTLTTKWHGFQNEPMVLPPDHIIVISCLDLDPRGLNVVFKILMLAGFYTDPYLYLYPPWIQTKCIFCYWRHHQQAASPVEEMQCISWRLWCLATGW
jgi:hypothetical protein